MNTPVKPQDASAAWDAFKERFEQHKDALGSAQSDWITKHRSMFNEQLTEIGGRIVDGKWDLNEVDVSDGRWDKIFQGLKVLYMIQAYMDAGHIQAAIAVAHTLSESLLWPLPAGDTIRHASEEMKSTMSDLGVTVNSLDLLNLLPPLARSGEKQRRAGAKSEKYNAEERASAVQRVQRLRATGAKWMEAVQTAADDLGCDPKTVKRMCAKAGLGPSLKRRKKHKAPKKLR